MTNNEMEEKEFKEFKRKVECWREVMLPLYSILLWERNWHPGLIVGLVTSIFCIIWLLEPAMLTIISISLLILALVDYLVPILISLVCNVQNWTGQKEKKLIEICRYISDGILQVQIICKSIIKTRHERPHIYYSGLIILLILLAWLATTVNNLFLFYIMVNAILLAPGLRHKGRVRSAVKYMYHFIRRKLS